MNHDALWFRAGLGWDCVAGQVYAKLIPRNDGIFAMPPTRNANVLLVPHNNVAVLPFHSPITHRLRRLGFVWSGSNTKGPHQFHSQEGFHR